MASLLSCIKQAAIEAVDEAAPCAVFFGRVERAEPLAVRLEGRFVLERNHLIRADRALNVREGDPVLLLRVQGGKRYVVLDTMRGGFGYDTAV
jgi:hypothetical protein